MRYNKQLQQAAITEGLIAAAAKYVPSTDQIVAEAEKIASTYGLAAMDSGQPAKPVASEFCYAKLHETPTQFRLRNCAVSRLMCSRSCRCIARRRGEAHRPLLPAPLWGEVRTNVTVKDTKGAASVPFTLMADYTPPVFLRTG
jgi:hypothetical protein